MDATALSIDEIIYDPKIRGGQPVIKGTGIRVIDLVAYHIGRDKMSAEALADSFRLELGQVYAALAYYYLHKDEVNAAMRAETERGEALFKVLEAQGKAERLHENLDEALKH
jgi:uncharacterized protein (DUF433 family)